MRTLSVAYQNALAAGGLVSRVLVWFQARNRTTSAVETIGLWTGADNQTFTVEGQARSYYGAGNIIDVPPVVYKTGLDVQVYRLGITSITDEARQLIRAYDPRFAEVEVHRALFDPLTRALIGAPHRVLAGTIDEVDLSRPPAGGQASCYLSVVTTARLLTYGLPNKNSHANQKRISEDKFLRYADAQAEVWWGTKRGGGS
jgi:hypothetical protein